jgi:hypothetical protein
METYSVTLRIFKISPRDNYTQSPRCQIQQFCAFCEILKKSVTIHRVSGLYYEKGGPYDVQANS